MSAERAAGAGSNRRSAALGGTAGGVAAASPCGDACGAGGGWARCGLSGVAGEVWAGAGCDGCSFGWEGAGGCCPPLGAAATTINRNIASDNENFFFIVVSFKLSRGRGGRKNSPTGDSGRYPGPARPSRGLLRRLHFAEKIEDYLHLRAPLCERHLLILDLG